MNKETNEILKKLEQDEIDNMDTLQKSAYTRNKKIEHFIDKLSKIDWEQEVNDYNVYAERIQVSFDHLCINFFEFLTIVKKYIKMITYCIIALTFGIICYILFLMLR